jgi:hypothetical protein
VFTRRSTNASKRETMASGLRPQPGIAVRGVGGSRKRTRRAGPNPMSVLGVMGAVSMVALGCDEVRLCEQGMCETTNSESRASSNTSDESRDDESTRGETSGVSSSDDSDGRATTSSRPTSTRDAETETPTCDPAEETCVGETRFCERWETEADGCVICERESNRGCGGFLPYCVEVGEGDVDAGRPPRVDCAECLDERDCGLGVPVCVDNRCVECATDDHCSSPEASRCDLESNTCVPCSEVGQCAHLDATPACDVERGVCVECTRDESDSCGDRVCNLLPEDEGHQTCSEHPKQSALECGECVNDAQCVAAHRCIGETNPFFSDELTGKYHCMPFEAELGEGKLCEHHRPFIRVFTATSLGGTSGNYCRPQYATCKALSMYDTLPDVIPDGEPNAGEAACLNDDSCGTPGVADGKCNGICTFYCGSEEACPEGSICIGLCIPERLYFL